MLLQSQGATYLCNASLHFSTRAHQLNVLQIYNDKNLEYMRSCEGWDELVKQYDEPILNENAVNAVKNLWAMFKRDK
jgi:hypothetical protein